MVDGREEKGKYIDIVFCIQWGKSFLHLCHLMLYLCLGFSHFHF